MKRWALSLTILSLFGYAALASPAWPAMPTRPEPLKPTTLVLPLVLVTGARIQGEFMLQDEGPSVIRLRLKRDRPLHAMENLIGGHWSRYPTPSGLSVAYVVSAEGQETLRGSIEVFRDHDISEDSIALSIVSLGRGEPVTHRLELHITMARAELADVEATVEVVPTGRPRGRRHWAVLGQRAALFVGYGLGLCLGGAWLVMLWRPRRTDRDDIDRDHA